MIIKTKTQPGGCTVPHVEIKLKDVHCNGMAAI